LALDVFGENVAGPDFPHDPEHFRPKIDGDISASRSRAERLAREATRNEIHRSTPRSAVEGADVVPYGEASEAVIVLAGNEGFSSSRVDLDGAGWAESEEPSPQHAKAMTREKCQLIHAS
jgi:hypothetical protein